MKSRSLRSSSTTSTVAVIAPSTRLPEPPYRHHDTFTERALPRGGLIPDSTVRNRKAQMTASDLIVAAPWIVFCIGLLILFIRLRRGHGR